LGGKVDFFKKKQWAERELTTRRNILCGLGPVSAHPWWSVEPWRKRRESERARTEETRRPESTEAVRESAARREGAMEPEKAEEAAKQPMEAEAGDSVDPRELGVCLIPLIPSASDG
jgi:hypothetical protein